MATRKLKYFEYSGHATELDDAPNQHMHATFDTPNGFILVVAGNRLEGEAGLSLSKLAIERIRYYLSNEVLDNPSEAVRNALIYANGFVHVMNDKNPDIHRAELSCLCLIVADHQVFYAWVGETCLYLYADRKLIPLNWDVYKNNSDSKAHFPRQLAYMGQEQILVPGLCPQPLIPVNDDILLMGSGGFCVDVDEKQIKKLLADSMPTHTKAVRMLTRYGEEILPSVCMVVQFYNLDRGERSYAVTPGAQPKHTGIWGTLSGRFSLTNPVVRKLLYLLAAIMLSYMIYDLLFFNPRPAVLVDTDEVMGDDTGRQDANDTAEAFSGGQMPGDDPSQNVGNSRPATRETVPPETINQAVVVPDDVLYRIKRGDTWSRIYREFEVCSWFIRNHPANRGKFDAANNPIAGNEIMIPLVYSAKQRLNPSFYQEFTIEKVGSSCQHANEEFIERFEQSLAGRRH